MIDEILVADLDAVTAAGLARAGGVARSWIYTQTDIIEAIRATERARPDPAPPTRGAQAGDASWRQRLELAHDRIKELTNDNVRLRKQLAHVHGQLQAQRTAPSKTPSTTQNA